MSFSSLDPPLSLLSLHHRSRLLAPVIKQKLHSCVFYHVWKLYPCTQTNIASKLRRLTFKSRNSRVFDLSTPYHFVRMRGPHLKGFAEVAVWKKDVSLSKLKPCTPIVVDTSTSAHFFGTGVASAWSSPSSNSDNSEVHVESSSVPEQDDGNAHKETQGPCMAVHVYCTVSCIMSILINRDV